MGIRFGGLPARVTAMSTVEFGAQRNAHACKVQARVPARTPSWCTLAAVALGCVFLLPPVSRAQDSTQGYPEQQTLPTIVVTATRLRQPNFGVPAAIGVVTRDQIVDAAPAVSLVQSLARVPGVVAQDRQSYAQDAQISIRGFGSRASFGVRGIRLLVDGLPASGPDGQGQTDTFDLATAERIEVLRGPFSALYGNAAGGVIQIFTRDGPARPTFGASTLVGSYGSVTQRLDAGGTVGDFNYVVDGTHFRTDGYRQHSAAERTNLRAKFRYDLGKDSSLTLLFNGENQPYAEDPSGLTAQQARDDPRLAVPGVYTYGAGEAHRDRQLGLVYEQQLGEADHVHVTGYGGTRRVIQFLPFSGSSANGGGAVVDLDDDSRGGGARWVHNFTLASAPLDLIMGVEYDRLHELRRGWVNDGGREGELRRNEDDVSSQAGEYVQAEWQPGRWRFDVGLRHSSVKFGSDDHYVTADDPNDSGARSFTSTDPVAGVLYRISPHLNVYANYGQGFETPALSEFAYRPDGQAGFNESLRPSTSRDYEAGFKGAWARTKFDLAVFRITTVDDIIVAASNDGRDSYDNAASTRRHGLELSVTQALPAGFDAYLAYTWLQARFGGGPFDGKYMPGVPRQMVYGALDWRYRPLGFSTSLSAAWRDKVYVDNQNASAAAGYAVLNYRFGFEQSTFHWHFREFASINNLLDRRYIGAIVVNTGNGRAFQPAPGRNVTLGVSASYAF
jgi:iron complex outermembrane receptor protein